MSTHEQPSLPAMKIETDDVLALAGVEASGRPDLVADLSDTKEVIASEAKASTNPAEAPVKAIPRLTREQLDFEYIKFPLNRNK